MATFEEAFDHANAQSQVFATAIETKVIRATTANIEDLTATTENLIEGVIMEREDSETSLAAA